MNAVTPEASATPGDQIVAQVPKDKLRSLFYLFSGKPDSRIKIFTEPVHLKRDDIVELNDCITRKLGLHQIDAVICTVKIGYDGSSFNEFGTWAEFSGHHWQEPDRIEEIVVKWDFLVKVASYEAPQRHTLLLRVSQDLKPSNLIQLMAAGNSDEFDQVDLFSSPAFCRVDFINAQLSKELINVVTEWYKGRKTPKLIPSHLYWFKKRRNTVAEILDQWMIMSWALLLTSFFLWGNKNYFSGTTPLHFVGIAVFLGIYSLRPVGRVAHHSAARVYKALAEIEGSRVLFEFTSGDRKRISELEDENKKQGRAFVAASVWNIVLNVVASIVYGVLFTTGQS